MDTIQTVNRLCECCMEEHTVRHVMIHENTQFKGVSVPYDAHYFYCDRADELYVDEDMIARNDIAMKNAYRKMCGLLTTNEIFDIRGKYGISQQDLCRLLGWGDKTITRYEGHQVQDKAHDDILRKIDHDPKWFLDLLENAQAILPERAYSKYQKIARERYEHLQEVYLKQAILSRYARYMDRPELTGYRELNLNIVKDIIRYFANAKNMMYLYKVKLMKLLWYSDALSFKRFGHSITGLVYQALPMGAVPIGYDSIIEFSGVPYEEHEYDNGTAYEFLPTPNKEYTYLSAEDMDILETIIACFGTSKKNDIVEAMHEEEAYKKTAPKDIILFQHAKNLSIT